MIIALRPLIPNIAILGFSIGLSQIFQSFLFCVLLLNMRSLVFMHLISLIRFTSKNLAHYFVFYGVFIDIFEYLLVVILFSVEMVALVVVYGGKFDGLSVNYLFFVCRRELYWLFVLFVLFRCFLRNYFFYLLMNFFFKFFKNSLFLFRKLIVLRHSLCFILISNFSPRTSFSKLNTSSMLMSRFPHPIKWISHVNLNILFRNMTRYRLNFFTLNAFKG